MDLAEGLFIQERFPAFPSWFSFFLAFLPLPPRVDFATTFTEDGICYTFNPDGARAFVNGTGRAHALRLVLNAEKYEYMRASASGPTGQFATGVKVVVHQAEQTNFQGKGFLVSPGTHTEVKTLIIDAVPCCWHMIYASYSGKAWFHPLFLFIQGGPNLTAQTAAVVSLRQLYARRLHDAQSMQITVQVRCLIVFDFVS